MSVTKIGIANSALIKIGAERISSISETNKRAQFCNEQIEKLKREVLRAHPWNFATLRAELAQTDAPEWGYDYAYELPADCLRVLKAVVDSELDEIEYKIEGATIVTDEPILRIKYIYDVTDYSLMDDAFAETLACRLAADLAYPIAGSNTLQATMMAAYEAQLKPARSYDGQEGSAEQVTASSWIQSRY
jgi:hypothetical protein